MKVVILTEGGRKIGFGHITRCLSLYQAFDEFGGKPEFVINGDKSVIEFAKQVNGEIVDWIEKSSYAISKIKDSDIVIIDSYLASLNFYELVAKLVRVPVYIDDNKRLDYPEGVIVNSNIYAKDLDYKTGNNSVFLLGTKYAMLRKEFWEAPEKEIKKNIESIMITFGGDDLKNMTPRVLGWLAEEYPDLRKNVIIGSGFENVNVSKIKEIADDNTKLIFNPDAKIMKDVMLESDIAISAGGQTLYELARIGVPTIAMIVAENQKRNVRKWESFGFIKSAKFDGSKDNINFVEYNLKYLFDYKIREESHCRSKRLIDGKGALRVARRLLDVANEAV